MGTTDAVPAPPSHIVETCLDVRDLGESTTFYHKVFGYEVMAGDDRFSALKSGDRVLLLFRLNHVHGEKMPIGDIPAHGTHGGSSHVGFAIRPEDLERWRERLERCGIPIESQVNWPRGGVSLYFRDPDGHLLEVMTPGVWPVY